MSTEAEKAFEAALVRETEELKAMSEEERFIYVKGTIESLANVLNEMAHETKRAKQIRMAKAFFEELNQKAPELIPPIIYSIKTEYQQVYINAMQQIAANVKP